MFIQAVLQGEANINLSWVRVLRLFRVFRIFKVGKLTFGFKIFLAAIKMSMTSFTILIFFMCILIILSSSLMYMFENQDPPHPMQARPDLFASIPDCMWWSIVTMTTVGYGDAVPATAPGKIVATFTMCLGLLTIALPVTVLGSNFTKVMDMYEEELDMYQSADTDGSGSVTEDELRFFLYSKRQQGLISDEYKQTAAQLMIRFDLDGKGERARARERARTGSRPRRRRAHAAPAPPPRRLPQPRGVQAARHLDRALVRADAAAHHAGPAQEPGQGRGAGRHGARAPPPPLTAAARTRCVPHVPARRVPSRRPRAAQLSARMDRLESMLERLCAAQGISPPSPLGPRRLPPLSQAPQLPAPAAAQGDGSPGGISSRRVTESTATLRLSREGAATDAPRSSGAAGATPASAASAQHSRSSGAAAESADVPGAS